MRRHRFKSLSLAVLAIVAGSCAHAAIPAAERAALIDLYNSAGGASWIYHLNWNGAAGTECGNDSTGAPSWFGITCDATGSHVVSIYLPQNNLVGTLPASIGAFSALQTLNVSTNSLSGTIPPLAGLTALQNVSLGQNSFSGALPALAGLGALVGFDASNNSLAGAIPALADLSNLQGFNVSVNNLSGSVPALSGLAKLQVVDVHANALTGSLPSLAGLTALQAFYAQGNQFSGAMPSLAGLSSLQFFNVDANQLSGAIPALTGLAALKNFDVGANKLSGAIPSLSGLGALNVLNVGGNQLTGVVPAPSSPSALFPGASVLCGNAFTATANIFWDAATGVTPWYSACGLSLASFNLDQRGLTGAWYNPATSGQGLLIESYKDLQGSGKGYLTAGWYTFDVTAAGGQRWYTLQGPAVSGDASSQLGIYANTGGNFAAPPKFGNAPQVGTATLSFSDCTNGTLTFSFNDGRNGTIPLTRIDPNITCSSAGDTGNATQNYLLSGAWFDPATSGQGFFFAVNPQINLMFGAWYTYAPNGAAIGGGASQRWYTLQDNAFAPGTTSKAGIAVYETTGGVFNSGKVSAVAVGTADLTIASCTAMTLAYNFTSGTNAGKSGTIQLSRVVGAPAGCGL